MRRRITYVAVMVAVGALVIGSPLIAGHGAATPALAAASPQQAAAAGGRPNVLLITADDMRADDLRFMPFTRSEFRRRAVTFADAVSPYPLCCPARAQIVTGQYNHNNGVRGNAWPNGGYWALRNRANTLPVWLRAGGYRTAFLGKYMNQYEGDPRDFRDPRGLLDGRRRYEVPPGWTHWYGSVGKVYGYTSVTVNADGPGTRPRRVSAGRYQTEYFGDLTRSLIRRYHRERRPFFIWASHLAPHTASVRGRWLPPIPAARDRGVHRRTRLPGGVSRAAFNASTRQKNGPMANRRPVDRAKVLRLHRRRAESLRSLDRAVRGAVRELQRTGEYARTTIIFTSDNGFMLGEHRFVGKDMPYEQALRVPMIVNAPRIKDRYRPAAGRRTRVTVPHAVTTTDIASTVVGVTGVRPGRRLDGLDMTRPAANPDHGPGGDRAVLVESGAKGARLSSSSRFMGVRTDRWTWFGWHVRPTSAGVQFGGRELYDRSSDPAQLSNLAGTSPSGGSLAALVREMHDCRGGGCVRSAP